jgi:hypothetical protein
LFGLFFRIERSNPVPLIFRRLLWIGILICYVGFAVWLVHLLHSPYASRALTIRSLLGLGALLPLAALTWSLLRNQQQ